MREVIAALLLTAIATPHLAYADVKAGVEAWQRGDYDAAIVAWLPAAQRGDADAQFNLGQAYKLGRGVPRDLKIAQDWYRKAALQGHWEAQDNYGLALFENGDAEAALPWLIGSARRGEPRAQYVLGTIYFNGKVVKQDWVRAYALMARASAAGLPQASTTLTDMDKYIGFTERQKGLALARDKSWVPPEDSVATNAPPSKTPAIAAAPIVEKVAERPAAAPSPPLTTRTPAAVKAPSKGEWAVQLGAFGEPGNAPRLWKSVQARFAGRDVQYVKAGKLTRVLVGPYASRGEAQTACAKISPCFPVRRDR